jgi:hypothetical protein
VSDDGQVVAGIWGAEVRTFGPDARTAAVAFDSPRALAFRNGSHDLAVATRAGVFQFGDTPQLLHPNSDANALAFTAGNRRLVLALSGGFLTADLEQGAEVQTECSCKAETLARAGKSVFRISSLSHGLFLLFDADTGQIYSVPLSADQFAVEEAQQ